jgi:hypothetical protein
LAIVRNLITDCKIAKPGRKLPEELYQSLTWDRGKEMAGHKRFTLQRTSRFISVILTILGSVGRMRIRTGC